MGPTEKTRVREEVFVGEVLPLLTQQTWTEDIHLFSHLPMCSFHRYQRAILGQVLC